MAIHFDLPADVERNLRQQRRDIDEAAKEAFILHGYSAGWFSLGCAAHILGLDTTIQAQEWMAQRGAPLNYSVEDLEADRKTAADVFGKRP